MWSGWRAIALPRLTISCPRARYKLFYFSSPAEGLTSVLVGGSLDEAVTVVGTGVKMSWAVLCTLSIGTKSNGSRTSTLVDSPDVKLVRSCIILQVTVKLLVARVMTNVLTNVLMVTNTLMLLLVLDIIILSQLEPSEQVHSMMISPEPVAVQVKVALSN